MYQKTVRFLSTVPLMGHFRGAHTNLPTNSKNSPTNPHIVFTVFLQVELAIASSTCEELARDSLDSYRPSKACVHPHKG